jgi:hypothetical protein
MQLQFKAVVIEWRGPAPFFYARIPAEIGVEIGIPVEVVIDGVAFETSLFPKDDTYLLPLKAAVRKRLGVTVDDEVEVGMTIGGGGFRLSGF